MRVNELFLDSIINEKKLPMEQEARIARAESMGFDTSTVYYHATNAKTHFASFKVGKNGVDELGSGIYLARSTRYIGMWSRGENGRTIPCFIRKGEYFDMARYKDKQSPAHKKMLVLLKQGHDNMMRSKYGEDGVYPQKMFDDFIKNYRGDFSALIAKCGFMGVVDHTSQIPDQVLVFDPANIRSVFAKFDPSKSESKNLLS